VGAGGVIDGDDVGGVEARVELFGGVTPGEDAALIAKPPVTASRIRPAIRLIIKLFGPSRSAQVRMCGSLSNTQARHMPVRKTKIVYVTKPASIADGILRDPRRVYRVGIPSSRPGWAAVRGAADRFLG
jgi:hypothetical protein